MAKHTQTIRRQTVRKLLANCLSVFDHFVRLALTVLTSCRMIKNGHKNFKILQCEYYQIFEVSLVYFQNCA